jgi:hypothetical protein
MKDIAHKRKRERDFHLHCNDPVMIWFFERKPLLEEHLLLVWTEFVCSCALDIFSGRAAD